MPPKKNKKKIEVKVEETIINYDIPLKPDDQLVLSQEALDDVLDNIFLIKEPPKPYTEIIYSYKIGEFVPKVEKSYYVKLIAMKSTLLHCESVEADIQIENELCRKPEDFSVDDNLSKDEIIEEEQAKDEDLELGEGVNEEGLEENMLEEENDEVSNAENEMDEMYETEEEKSLKAESEDENEPVRKKSKKKEESVETIQSLPIAKLCVVVKLKNKFNFFDRFVQTKIISSRDASTQTKIEISGKFQTSAERNKSYDACRADFQKQMDKKEEEARKKIAAHMTIKHAGIKKNQTKLDPKALNLLKMSKIIERFTNLCDTDAIAQDFRYYEDPTDQFRKKGEGTLMLLWTMVFEKPKIFTVTDICWNPIYFDMFAITISIPQCDLSQTMETNQADVGYVCLWLLKNSSYPDFVTETECGAICLNFHQEHAYNLVVGFRDGGLAVYNISIMSHKPTYKTDLAQTRHMDCVRQVVWGKDLPSGDLNFFSVSEDGTVCQWLLVEYELLKIVIMSLVIEMDPEIVIAGVKETYYAKGTTITFNPNNDELYMIGTTEGYVYKCNTAMRISKKFKAHEMSINRIDYNNFDMNVFVTCSDDFMVKLWENNSETPLIVLNLKKALCDVRWSPFSSTVFVILTVDCHLIFYDLDVSMKKPVCDQLIQPADEYRPTRMVFNKLVPIVLVGSSRSTVITYKLSPGLRATMKPSKKGPPISVEELELDKLHAILDSVRGPTDDKS